MKLKRFIIIILLSLMPIPLLAQSTLLPLPHPAYDFLERMEVQGLLDYPLLGSKPITRARISVLLDEVHEKSADNPDLLSRVDREMLAVLRWEFARDAERSGRKSPPAIHPNHHSRLTSINRWLAERSSFFGSFYRNGINLYSFESQDFDGYIDPRGSARVILQKGENRSIVITSVGIRLRAHFGNHAGMYVDFSDITERGRGPYWDRSQLYEDRVGFWGVINGDDAANYDITDFDLAFGGGFWELHAAKFPLRWGPGQSGQLLLSDWGPSFHQIQAAFQLGSRLRLVYIFGSLKTQPEVFDSLYVNAGYLRTIEASKYIAAHRLEWDLHPRLKLAFAEAVIFGERNPELAYLIPINFFHSAQHDLGDEDNALLCFDGSYIFSPGWKLYGELLIDDITFDKLGTDFYGNKLGWIGGITAVQPLGLKNLDATLEMAQIRPFVYTHQYPVNVYTHWTSPLGYRYDPNSEVLYCSMRYRPHWRTELTARWIRHLHGKNTEGYNAGGDILIAHENHTAEDAPFLGGILEEIQRFELVGKVEILTGLYLWSNGAWITTGDNDSWEWEVGFRLN